MRCCRSNEEDPMLGANGCLLLCSHTYIPQTHTYIHTQTPHPTHTQIPHPGEGGGHGSESHCQRPNGRVSREHGRRLRVRIETVSSTTSSTLKVPEAARAQGGGCCVESESDAKIFGSSEDRAGDYVQSDDNARGQGSAARQHGPKPPSGGGDASTVSVGCRYWP